MPHNRYFCHACQQEFEPQDTTNLQCSHCGSDFVEKVTELTFTREERQVRRQQSQTEDTSHNTSTNDVNNDEQTTGEMLFGPQGLFNTLIPIIIDVDAVREGGNEREGEAENENNTNDNTEETQRQSRRESFGHNLVHSIIPRVLQRILHRHEQSDNEQRDGTDNTTNRQDTNETEHDHPVPLTSLDFTIPQGGRGRIAIFARNQ